MSEAAIVFDPDRLKEIISELGQQLQPLADDQRLQNIDQTITLVDGSLIAALPRIMEASFRKSQTGHRIQLFGGPSHGGIEVLGQYLCGHQLQNGVPNTMVPPARKSSIGNRRKKAFELDKQVCLTRIFQIPHHTAP